MNVNSDTLSAINGTTRSNDPGREFREIQLADAIQETAADLPADLATELQSLNPRLRGAQFAQLDSTGAYQLKAHAITQRRRLEDEATAEEEQEVAEGIQASYSQQNAAEQAQMQRMQSYYSSIDPHWNSYAPAAQQMMLRQDVAYNRVDPVGRMYTDVQTVLRTEQREEVQAEARQTRRDLEALALQQPDLADDIRHIQEASSGIVPPTVRRIMNEHRDNPEALRTALRDEAAVLEQRRGEVVERSRTALRNDQERTDVDGFAERAGRRPGGHVSEQDRARFNDLVQRATGPDGQVDPGRLSEADRQEMRFHNFNINIERRVINQQMGAWAARYLSEPGREQQLAQIMQREPQEISRMMTDAGLIRRGPEGDSTRNIIETQFAGLSTEDRVRFVHTLADQNITEAERTTRMNDIYRNAMGVSADYRPSEGAMMEFNNRMLAGGLDTREEASAYIDGIKQRITAENAAKSPAPAMANGAPAETTVQTAEAGGTKPPAIDLNSPMGQALATAVKSGATNPSVSGGEQADRSEPVTVTAGTPGQVRQQAMNHAVG